jgi:hypothetical protein
MVNEGQMSKLEEVELAISKAAYPDVHPDFTDAGWKRMARAAIEAMQNPTKQMVDAAMQKRDSLGLLVTQARPEKEYNVMIEAALH